MSSKNMEFFQKFSHQNKLYKYLFYSMCQRKCFLATEYTEYTEKRGRIQKNKEKPILIFPRDFHS